MATFLASGSDILQAPNVNTLAGAGQDAAGQITVTGGTQLFSDQSIVEFTVDQVSADGELTTQSGFTQIVVYATQADFLAGTPTYTYTPQNPGQKATVQDSVDRMGDNYIRFGASVLTSSDPGAPSLSELFVAPGSNVASQSSTTFDRNTDEDFNSDGSIDPAAGEDGDGTFNVNSGQASGPVCFTSGSYVQTPGGLVLIDKIRPGDMVSTLDNGPQPVLWVSTRQVGPADMVIHPRYRPAFIAKGAWGALHNTLVSQQHCVLVRPHLLMPAKKLVEVPRSRVRIANGVRRVTYIHFLFERHEVIWVNGIASESLYPGPQCRRDIGQQQRRAMRSVVPNVPMGGSMAATVASYGPTARPVVRKPVADLSAHCAAR